MKLLFIANQTASVRGSGGLPTFYLAMTWTEWLTLPWWYLAIPINEFYCIFYCGLDFLSKIRVSHAQRVNFLTHHIFLWYIFGALPLRFTPPPQRCCVLCSCYLWFDVRVLRLVQLQIAKLFVNAPAKKRENIPLLRISVWKSCVFFFVSSVQTNFIIHVLCVWKCLLLRCWRWVLRRKADLYFVNWKLLAFCQFPRNNKIIIIIIIIIFEAGAKFSILTKQSVWPHWNRLIYDEWDYCGTVCRKRQRPYQVTPNRLYIRIIYTWRLMLRRYAEV